MKKSVVKGSFVLIVSGLVCKLLGALFRLPLTNILGIEGIGIFQMVMAVYSFALVFTSGGISSVLSKYVSQARARSDYAKVSSLFKTALSYAILLGIIAGGILFVLAVPISKVQGIPQAIDSYRIMIILIPFGGIVATMRGIFQGYENMTPTAVSQIIEQSFKFALGLFFAQMFSSSSLKSGVLGAFLGVCSGEVIAIGYLAIYMKIKSHFASEKQKFSSSTFIKAVVPLSIGASVLPLSSAVDSFIVVSRLKMAGIEQTVATSLFGVQAGIVGAILNFPLILSTSLSVAILPSISYLDAKLSQDSEKSISQALKILWFVLLPLSVGIACICKPLYALVYPSLDSHMLSVAVNLTYLGVISTIITALTQFFVTLLQAKGEWTYIMVSYFLGGIAKAVCVAILCAVPSVNIFGVTLGNIALSSIVCILALIKNKRKILVHVFDLALPLLSSFAMALVLNLFNMHFQLSLLLQIVFSILIGGLVYLFFTLPLLAGIFKEFFAKKIEGGKNEQNSTN